VHFIDAFVQFIAAAARALYMLLNGRQHSLRGEDLFSSGIILSAMRDGKI
jgi:hypothetical protein